MTEQARRAYIKLVRRPMTLELKAEPTARGQMCRPVNWKREGRRAALRARRRLRAAG